MNCTVSGASNTHLNESSVSLLTVEFFSWAMLNHSNHNAFLSMSVPELYQLKMIELLVPSNVLELANDFIDLPQV